MIVDDEPDTLFIEWFLSDEGYNVEGFTNPQQALKHFVKLSGASPVLSASTFGT